jgi:hypothetical protein
LLSFGAIALSLSLLSSLVRFSGGGDINMLRICTDGRIMLYMETVSNFIRKDWIPNLLAGVLNAPPEIPFVWVGPTEIENKYGTQGRRLADAAFMGCLQALVSQWIDSGRDSEGREVPLKRNLSGRFPNSEDSLYETLVTWVTQNVRPSLQRTGKLVAFDPIPFFPRRDPESFGREFAIYWFVMLLDCPGAQRLSRCGNLACGGYYARRRVRSVEIKRGAFCPMCSGAGSMVRTRFSRAVRKQQLIKLGADVWRTNWKPTPRHPKLSEWVVAQMKRKKASIPVTITGKWISQNRKAIEMEVERRKNAKG